VTRFIKANRLERIGWIALAVMCLIQGYLGVFVRDNDFSWHMDQGRLFLTGRPADVERCWYPLARYAWDASLAMLPGRAARATNLALSAAALAATLMMWRRMLAARWPIERRVARRATLVALLLASPFLRRDFDDCGSHLLFLFLLSATVYCCAQERSGWAGVFGGLATCYKPTAALLWPFLIWKGRWKAAATMPVVFITLNLAPAMFLNWDQTIRYHRKTAAVYQRAAANRDFLANGIEPARHENQSLTFAIARYLQYVPPGHELFLNHRMFVQFGELTPEAAGAVINAIRFAIAAWFAWRTRPKTSFVKPSDSGGDRGSFAAEAAGIFVLVAILSPLCWKQHLVLLLPALMTATRVAAYRGTQFIDRLLAIAFAAAGVLLSKDVFGRELAAVAASYKIDAILAFSLFVRVVLLATVPAAQPVKRRLAVDRLPVARYQRRRVPIISGVRPGAGRPLDDSRIGVRVAGGDGRLRQPRADRARPTGLARRQSDDQARSIAADA